MDRPTSNKKINQKFGLTKWPVVGHEKIVASLKKNILKRKLSHAFLFSGSKGLGKMTVAKCFAKTLQCQADNRFCGRCDSCLKIDKNQHPDTIILQTNGSLKIEEVRLLRRKLSLTPSDSPYKICIINQIENLTKEAANALLKILEEPAENTLIILISENHEKILPTVVSRCVLLKFFPVSIRVIEKYFFSQNLRYEKNFLEKIILSSGGKPGFVFENLANPEKFKEINRMVSEFNRIFLNPKKNFGDFDKLSYVSGLPLSNREKLKEVLNIWIGCFHNLLVLKSGVFENICSENKNFLKKYSLNQIKKNILEINKTKFLLSKNANTKLLMENLVLNL